MSFMRNFLDPQRSAPVAEPDAASGEAAVSGSESTADYEACVQAARGAHPRLRLQFANGTVGLMAYAYLVEVLSHSHQHLALVYTNVAISLEGRHLDQLLDLLQDERVKALVCHRPQHHDTPPADKPIITKMVRQSLQELAARQREEKTPAR